MTRTLVLGLGNDILTDDAVGLLVVREVRRRLSDRSDVTVLEASVGGLEFLDLCAGYDRVILVDAIKTLQHAPGTILHLEPGVLPAPERMRMIHEVDLVTALELGRRLGHPMPSRVEILAVEVADDLTLGETPTTEVSAAVKPAAEEVMEMLLDS